MKEVEYPNLVKESWVALIKNPILLMPGIIMLFFSVALVFFYLSISGILDTIIGNPEILTNKSMLNQSIGLLLLTNPFKSFFSLIIYIMLVILFDVFFISMKYGMVRDVILKKKASFISALKFAKNNYFKVIGVYLISSVIILFPLVFIVLFIYSFFVSTGFFANPLGFAITIFIVILGVVYAAYMLFRLLFVYPVMVFEEGSITKSIKKDFHYVKTHLTHTLISWLIVIGVLLSYFIIRTPIIFLGDATPNIFIVIALPFIIFLIENIFSMWEHLFIFKSYKEGKR